jgi:DNA-binding transcriptional ArsR family regulator
VSDRSDVFGAIADPTRRAILDLLADRATVTAGELADEFPEISRPAVSKHVRVLRAAGLVQARKQGREVYYSLDPRPLAQVYERWLSRFAPVSEESLRRLKRRVEQGVRGDARATK